MADLVDISSQFKGLPMGDLIGGPLTAACDAQIKLANATADFIRVVGFLPPDANNKQETRTASFKFKRPIENTDPATAGATPFLEEEVELEVPLLALVNVPSLAIQRVDIKFDMEVKSSFSAKEQEDKSGSFEAEAKVGWGVFSARVKVQGSVATHKENARSSDNSAKYTVSVLAEDKGMPEGLSRVLDILQTAVAPRKIGDAVPVAP